MKYKIKTLFLIVFCFACVSIHAMEPELIHTAEPNRLRQTWEEALKNAKESILVMTFSFSDPALIELVNQKSREGVETVIVIDKDHQGPILRSCVDQLNILTRYSGEGRVHHKILVIDHRYVWIGSANFTASAFSSQENLVVGLESSEFANALHREADVFKGVQQRESRPPASTQLESVEATLFLLPHANPAVNGPEKAINARGKQELLELIHGAKSHIRIAMMIWTDPELEKAILEAHRKGVLVEVLFQDLQDTVSRNLKNAGVHVFTNPNLNFMHNKWMLVDHSILVNGSANWSRSSFSRNDESFIVLKNLSNHHTCYLEDYWGDLIAR